MKKLLVTGAVLVSLVLGGVGLSNLLTDNNPQIAETPQSQQAAVRANNGDLVVSEDGKTVTYSGVEGVTALNTLKSLTNVTTDESSFGEFVTGIHGLTADSNTEFWAFYVNDKLSTEGAGTYKTVNGDTFKWQLEKLQ